MAIRKHLMHRYHKKEQFEPALTFHLSGTDVIIGYVLIAIGGINLLATQFQIANLYKTRF